MTETRIRVIALDYGGTLSQDRIDHLLGEKPVDPAAAAAVRVLHDDLGLRLVLASNTRPGERRWPALAAAGIDGLFCCALLSYPLGTAKPEPLFWSLLLAAARDALPARCWSATTTCATTWPRPWSMACARCWSGRAGCGPGNCYRTAR